MLLNFRASSLQELSEKFVTMPDLLYKLLTNLLLHPIFLIILAQSAVWRAVAAARTCLSVHDGSVQGRVDAAGTVADGSRRHRSRTSRLHRLWQWPGTTTAQPSHGLDAAL